MNMYTDLSQIIVSARKAKGWTQEELAEQSNVTIRTIQRLENNENAPRLHTLKAVANVLDISIESAFVTKVGPDSIQLQKDLADVKVSDNNSLRLINIASFTYLLIPFCNFLILIYLIGKRKTKNADYTTLGWRIIKSQILWNVCTNLLMILTLAYNIIQASYFDTPYLISYFIPFIIMYLVNIFIIYLNDQKIAAT